MAAIRFSQATVVAMLLCAMAVSGRSLSHLDGVIDGEGHKGSCPGPEGLAGGWSQASTSDEGVIAAVDFLIATLNLENREYVIDTACTQVVAGIKYFLEVELVGGGSFGATLLRPLPGDNSIYNNPFQILELVFQN
mmetsp:Transcript_15046/g.42226  ORF Transcript_15046/g.42226 Transcript_15046/m.42226 type:complete len:136 (+) Transcript_15046:828-1235(+)|eukprot:CAMPEP_0117673356 /NCGR_PEP_ID=MMETSP0804-20121206/14426_1 /TAXON_ID=1074897 /ORGANISM="Tetraselmis astigmatica, Strain CCMP880" /LENGTH=135 /DNA_ID=CAMNT_0005482083 /DNA_START=733 /DNA_END=1140 /DNA_ORIENTATION=-